MKTGIEAFDEFIDILQIAFSPFLLRVDFMGFMVRPLDFILFFGFMGLIIDIYRMVVMRGQDE